MDDGVHDFRFYFPNQAGRLEALGEMLSITTQII